MTALQVVLFGGLELWSRGRRRPGFESQKTAALFAYLILHRGKRFSREHLAALLWPETEEGAARANLRQALYNLRSTLPRGKAAAWILADRDGVAFARIADVWVDCEEFEELFSLEDASRAPTHALLRAAELYRGDLLAGLAIRGSEPFEAWLLSEQERLRRLALEGLERLVEIYSQRGEYRLGIKYAAKLVELDPFSESGHRALMLLYGFAGERSRAMVHYRQLAKLLKSELGISPQPETRRVYERIASEIAVRKDRPALIGRFPAIPLVGRKEALAQLEEAWWLVSAGNPLVTVVEGEEGVGKSRLVRSFLDSLSSRQSGVVLTARFPSRWPQDPFEPLKGLLSQMLARQPGDRAAACQRLSAQGKAVLAALYPECLGGTWRPERLGEPGSFMGPGFAEVVRWFVSAGNWTSDRPPLVLFLDDADHAGPSTLRLLGEVIRDLGGVPVWLVVTCSSASATGLARALRPRVGDVPSGYSSLRVGRLTGGDVDEIARELVDGGDVSNFSRVLAHASSGLPLAIVTLINTLCDEGVLQVGGEGSRRWRLSSRRELTALAQLSVPELVLRRLNNLSPSVRRVAALAAVAVEDFDAELLARAEGELPEVIQVGIETLIDRWLIRLTPNQWASGGLEAGRQLWQSGARKLRFDFDHPVIGRAILYSLHPGRRRVLHALLAQVLRQDESAPLGGLAFHHGGAGNWLEAVATAAGVMEQALELGATEDAAHTMQLVRRWIQVAKSERPDLGGLAEWRSVLARVAAIEAALSQRRNDLVNDINTLCECACIDQ